MQPRPPFDRALLIPIAIGVVSILGIGWILLTSDRGGSPIPPTATPSSFSSLEDETHPTAAETGPDSYPNPPTETLPSISTLIAETLTPTPSATPTPTESIPTPSATYTPDLIQPLLAGKYDDTDPNIAYDAYWTLLKTGGTANAYKGTLHVTAANGNEASFRFTGKQVRLGYQRGTNFGVVTVIIDDQTYSFQEQILPLFWLSPPLSPGDHFVRIIQQSGQSINLDYIEILD